MTEPLPPVHDLDAEATVLSAIMLAPEKISLIERIVRPTDFFSDSNRRIAAVCWELDREGGAVDTTTVATRLRTAGQLEAIGGTPYLLQLTGETPSIAHVEDHARIVATTARIRRLQAVCRLVVAEGYAALTDAAEWFQEVERRIFEATDQSGTTVETLALFQDAVAHEYAALREQADGKREAPGVRTRIKPLDNVLGGGLVDSVPYVVAGRPGHGKTALGWQIAEGVARDGHMVVFLSQEMPREQLVRRAMCQAANIEPAWLRKAERMRDEDWVAVNTAMLVIEKLPIAIDDAGGQTVHGARSAVRRGVQKLHAKGHRGRLGLVVLDYLQIMGGDRRHGDSRATQVADNMHGVTRLAKEFRCPVLVLSQLNREIDKRPDKRPQLSDLGESGAIEADAYGVVFVYREDCYRDEKDRTGEVEIVVSKHRNGRTGTVTMCYAASTLFAGLADQWDGDFEDPDDSERRHP